MQRLATGEIDFVGELSPQDVKQLQARPNIALQPITVGRWYSLQWHMFKEPFNNPKLRQAIAHGIDRKRISDIVMDGKGTVSDGPTPPGLWWFDPSIKSYAFDPDKAKVLLSEVGYSSGFEFALSTPHRVAGVAHWCRDLPRGDSLSFRHRFCHARCCDHHRCRAANRRACSGRSGDPCVAVSPARMTGRRQALPIFIRRISDGWRGPMAPSWYRRTRRRDQYRRLGFLRGSACRLGYRELS